MLFRSGETVIGASVVVKGTTNGTITGLDGDFSLSNVKKGDIIQISFVGYQTVEIPWDGQPMNVTLQDDTQTLGEVVVTALGIKREKKALGYAMQDVSDDLHKFGVDVEKTKPQPSHLYEDGGFAKKQIGRASCRERVCLYV